MSEKLTGVILAAGKGSRMAPFSTSYPKPLLPVCNKPILVHQLDHMRSMGITDVVVVVGHLGYEISRVLGDGHKYGVNIRYVEQKDILGIAHAVSRLENVIKNKFLLFLGDIFFDTQNLSSMLDDMEKHSAGAVLAVKEEPNREAIKRNFAVVLDDHGMVRRVIEKPRYTNNHLKGCGLYLFDLPIFDAIRRTPRTAMRDEYEITDSIQILIDDGYPVVAANVVLDDINVSFPHDLLECNLMQLRKANRERLLADPAVESHARFENSIVGAKVTFANPISVRNSLIFEGTEVSTAADLDYAIVTPENMIDCRNLIKGATVGAYA